MSDVVAVDLIPDDGPPVGGGMMLAPETGVGAVCRLTPGGKIGRVPADEINGLGIMACSELASDCGEFRKKSENVTSVYATISMDSRLCHRPLRPQ